MLRSMKNFPLRCHNTPFAYIIAFLSLWALYDICTRQALRDQRRPSINVVLATLAKDDTSWTRQLALPNLEIIPYIADNQSALHHPPVNKGNEAMVYLAYCYDFYDNLPDISIFTHGQDHAWHIDGILDYSTIRAINSLDLHEVLHRQYFNLRVSWENACPAWINTSMTLASPEFDAKLREEEPFVREAFNWFLPNHTLPAIFAAPCCSQFAATRSAIHSLPRETYRAAMEWIEMAHLPSSVTGRVFERLWQYMFLGRPVDCPDEFKALCRVYHICFEDEEDWKKWRNIERSSFELDSLRSALLRNGFQPRNQRIKKLGKEIDALQKMTRPWRARAVHKGRSGKVRMEIAGGEF